MRLRGYRVRRGGPRTSLARWRNGRPTGNEDTTVSRVLDPSGGRIPTYIELWRAELGGTRFFRRRYVTMLP